MIDSLSKHFPSKKAGCYEASNLKSFNFHSVHHVVFLISSFFSFLAAE